RSSTHYRYRGRCIQFRMRDQTVTTPYSVLNPTSPPEKITYRTMRSVHGPVFAFARVHGAPVPLSKDKAVAFQVLSAALPFIHLLTPATGARPGQGPRTDHLVEQQGGAGVAQGADGVEQRPGAPRDDPAAPRLRRAPLSRWQDQPDRPDARGERDRDHRPPR